MINFLHKKNNQKGAAMLVSVIFFIFISLAILTGLTSPIVREFRNTTDLIRSRQSFVLSESGVEDVYYRYKTAKVVTASESLTLDNNTVVTTTTDSGFNQKTITGLGDVSSRQRKTEIRITPGDGIAFNYGIQTGQGGFYMSNNSGINGNVYSNGLISGAPGAYISGTAVAAGSGTISNLVVGSGTTGNAWAHTVTSSTVYGNLYCQTGSGNNKLCNTSQGDAPTTSYPVTDQMIADWKADAELGGTVTGNLTISSPTSLGPKKITGNLIINKDLTITGTIYVMGNITTGNNVNVSLSSSYGGTGGIIVVDGTVDLSNNVVFQGSGTSNTYVLLITTSECPTGCGSTNALEVANNVGAVILNAQKGTTHINNNVTLNAVTAYKIVMDNNVVINYLTGLADTSFSSGPSGGWNILLWKEVK